MKVQTISKRVVLLIVALVALALLTQDSFGYQRSSKPPPYVTYTLSPANTPVYHHAHAKKKYTKKKHKKYQAKSHRTYRNYGFAKKRKATGRRVFIFSPRLKAWAAYDRNGQLVRTGRASGGRSYCPDIKRSCRTPRGIFRVRSKGSPSCRSSTYPVGKGGAPMPYCMFYSKYYAIHGSPHVPNYNASHGCIRVLPSAARWLSHNFITIGTTVIVTSY